MAGESLQNWPSFETPEDKAYIFREMVGETLRFGVMAAHDCHLAFTSGPEEGEPMLEVFIGAWEGAASAVRYNKGNDLVKVDTPDILSDGEYREFWVCVEGSHVRVGRGGEWEPLMECSIPESFPITHYGYSTGYGAYGYWHIFSGTPMEYQAEYTTGEEKSYKFRELKGRTLKFSVQAIHNCHLAFTAGPEQTDNIVEIFIGAWEGAASAIRFRKGDDLVKVDTPDFLNGDEHRSFWVAFDSDYSSVKVGKDGSTSPFMETAIPEPFEVTHFGFSTGYGATGKFKFAMDKYYETADCLNYNFAPAYNNSFAFSVACNNDAHIALTPFPAEGVPMIEIFIGGWKNRNSGIRLNNDPQQTMVKVESPDIVCCQQMRTFWLTFKDGNICVGKHGSSDPFIQFEHPEPFQVTHIGYCSAWGASGKWRLEV